MKTTKLILVFLVSYWLQGELIYSQTQIPFGIINNSGNRQINSSYILNGSAGVLSVYETAGISYRVQAGFWQLYSNATVINYPSSINLITSYTFEDATKTSSYKMIGLPGYIDIPFASLLSGTAGKDGDWRAFWDPGVGSYLEFDGTTVFNFKPGRAFWLLSKNILNINQTVSTVPLSNDRTYPIPIHNEWNLISNPFNQSISWELVKNVNPGISENIHYYDSGIYKTNVTFDQYKGYYFFNNPVLGIQNLKIPYFTSGSSLPKQNNETFEGLEIVLTLNDQTLSGINICVADDAEYGLDNYDKFSPPSNFCDVMLCLHNQSLSTEYKYLQKEFRKEIGEGQEYILHVKNISENNLLLSANGLDYFPENEIYILDKNRNQFYNLKKENRIEVENNSYLKEFLIFIGSSNYIHQKKLALLPNENTMYQNYPNPFNPVTTIKFALLKPGRISLNVYNVIGELISQLILNKIYSEGYHEVLFAAGSLPSGVYIYQLQADEFTISKKMIILK